MIFTSLLQTSVRRIGSMGGHLLVSVLPSIALINDRSDGLLFQHILAVVDILLTR